MVGTKSQSHAWPVEWPARFVATDILSAHRGEQKIVRFFARSFFHPGFSTEPKFLNSGASHKITTKQAKTPQRSTLLSLPIAGPQSLRSKT